MCRAQCGTSASTQTFINGTTLAPQDQGRQAVAPHSSALLHISASGSSTCTSFFVHSSLIQNLPLRYSLFPHCWLATILSLRSSLLHAPLLSHTWLHHAPIFYDIASTSSMCTLVDCTVHSLLPAVTLVQPAMELLIPVSSHLILCSLTLPGHCRWVDRLPSDVLPQQVWWEMQGDDIDGADKPWCASNHTTCPEVVCST